VNDLDDAWILAQGEENGKSLIVRCRQNLSQIVAPESYPKMIQIVWEFDVDEESGLPSPALNDRMIEFEDLLIPGLEEDLTCVFFGVYVHNGVRVWSAYTGDPEAVCERINDIFADRNPYPLQISAEDDPDWTEYAGLLASTRDGDRG